MANYRNHDRQQMEMKIMCVNDFVEADHPARIIISIIDRMDLTAFDNYYNNDSCGTKAYPIKTLLAVLTYAYICGLYHSRKIEQACRENIVYRFLCCDDVPDHSTISRFWSRFREEIEGLMIQTVYIGQEQGLIDFEHLSGDGVKIMGIGSRDSLFNKEAAKTKLENIKKCIIRLGDDVESASNKEKEKELLEKISVKENLKDRIEEGMEELEQIQEAKKTEKQSGSNVEIPNYIHITDKGARLLKSRDGYVSGFNAQALSDSKFNMIVSAYVSENINDYFNGKPLLERFRKIVETETFQQGVKSFDNGFFHEELIKYGLEYDLDLYIDALPEDKTPDKTYKKRSNTTPDLVYDKKKNAYRCKAGECLHFNKHRWINGRAYAEYTRNCKGCPLLKECRTEKGRPRRKKSVRVERLDKKSEIQMNKNLFYEYMKQKMSSEEAKKIYRIRFHNIEPVFAQIKENKGFRRFTVYGKHKAQAQWHFVCYIQNFSKIMKYSSFGRELNVA